MICCRTQKKISQKTANIIDVVALVFALAVIVALFSLPIVFYYISDHTDFSDTATENNILNSKNNKTNDTTINCTMTWSRRTTNITSSNCNHYVYLGTICRTFLTKWNFCTLGDADIIYINEPKHTQSQKENDLLFLNSFLVHYQDCQQIAIPFFCQYYFPLYDCPGGEMYTASREDCIDISTGVCALQWNVAISYGYGDRLPDCLELPSYTGNGSSVTQVGNSTLQNITCKDDFNKVNNTCQPRCDRFEQASHTQTQIFIYSELIASCLCLFVCIIIIVLSIKDYKTMLSYPSVIIIFEVIDCASIGIVVIIISIDRNGLLCSSTSLIDSLNNPTPFCIISGAVFHYAIVNMTLWWFFHVTIFFHKVVFPFHANQMTKLGRNKYVFVVIIVLALGIPLPAVILSLSVEDYYYRIYRFPPGICITNGAMLFYSMTALIDILVGIGVYLLFVVFWIIHRNSLIGSKSSKKKIQLTTAEKKILIVMCCYVVFVVVSLAHSGDVTAKSEKSIAAVTEYFKCEALGYVPGKCNRSKMEQYNTSIMSAIAYTMLGLMPLGIITFVLKWRAVKEVTVKLFRWLARKFSKCTNISPKNKVEGANQI